MALSLWLLSILVKMKTVCLQWILQILETRKKKFQYFHKKFQPISLMKKINFKHNSISWRWLSSLRFCICNCIGKGIGNCKGKRMNKCIDKCMSR